MFKIFFIILVAYCNSNMAFLMAQDRQLSIEYDFNFIRQNGKKTIKMLSDQHKNLQTIVRSFELQTAPGVVENKIDKRFFYTNFTKQKISYWEEFVDVYVKESLNTMTWELTGNTKKILNYTCNEARSTWRGRDYIAYFTTELPFKAAPWKFHGLPGVMLEIKSADGNLIIKAKQLKTGINLGAIINPFTNQELIGWNEFVKKYKSKQHKNKELDAKGSVIFGKKTIRIGTRIELITEIDLEYENNYKTMEIKK